MMKTETGLTYNIEDVLADAKKSRPKFSDPEPHGQKMITPLGAAIVEALPDRKLVYYIKKRFRVMGQVPISSLFTAEQIVKFYEEHDMKIKPSPRGARPSKEKCLCITEGA